MAVVSSVFPSVIPFAALEASRAEMAKMTQEERDVTERGLFVLQSILHAMLDEAALRPSDNRRPQGFRSQMQAAIRQLGITGDTAFRLDDDVRVTVFRRDNYVAMRDSYGDLLCGIVRENIDIAEAPQAAIDEWKKANDGKNPQDVDYDRRMVDIYTKVEWVQSTKKWSIRQEVLGVEVAEKEEDVCSYFFVPYALIPGESYGRGPVEETIADLNSYNGLSKCQLEHAGLAVNVKVFVADDSLIRDDDLMKPAGSIVRGARVSQGVLQDAAAWGPVSLASAEVMNRVWQQLGESLARRFLYLPGQVRDSERTTAAEVQNVTLAQNEGARGLVYTPVADMLQIPIMQRLMVIAEKKNYVNKVMPSESKQKIRINLLTGAAAVARQQKVQQLVQYATIARDLAANPLPDEINLPVLLQVISRHLNITDPIVRTPEQVAQVQQARAQQEAQAEMAKQLAAGAGELLTNSAVTNTPQ
jgi:Arc/MetJ family transcription regulator